MSGFSLLAARAATLSSKLIVGIGLATLLATTACETADQAQTLAAGRALGQDRVLHPDGDRVDIMTPYGIWTGVGTTAQQDNDITGNFIGPDGELRLCTLHTDGRGNVVLSECP